MKKHIIFDFDDTITSSYEFNQQLFVETFLPYKPDIDQDYLRKLHFEKRGTAMVLQFEEAAQKFGLSVTPDRLREENEKLHQQRGSEINIFDGFEEILKEFKRQGKVISVCTNRETPSLNVILKKHGLSKYLDNVVSCIEAGHEKPDPFCLIKLMKKYPHIAKTEIIYFGDSKTDAQFATNAGIDFLVVDHYLNNKLFYKMMLEAFGCLGNGNEAGSTEREDNLRGYRTGTAVG